MSKRNQPFYRRGSAAERQMRFCLCLLSRKNDSCCLGRREELLADLIQEGLTGRQEEYLRLYYNDRLTQRQIAERLGIQIPAVSRGIRRGEEQIAHALRRLELLTG